MDTLPYEYEKYKIFPMSQRLGVNSLFKSFLEVENFDVVIEIGTWHGGFACMLSDILFNKFHTYDIKDNTVDGVKEVLINNNSNFHIEDVFESKSLKTLIKAPGRILLLCDGGNKAKEINQFGPLLKKDDIIMAHDFFISKEKHDSNRWRSCEVTAKDFDYAYLVENQYYSDMFEPYVWGIRVKI